MGIYITKSLSSPELVHLRNYAHSIDRLRPGLPKPNQALTQSYNALQEVRHSVY